MCLCRAGMKWRDWWCMVVLIVVYTLTEKAPRRQQFHVAAPATSVTTKHAVRARFWQAACFTKFQVNYCLEAWISHCRGAAVRCHKYKSFFYSVYSTQYSLVTPLAVFYSVNSHCDTHTHTTHTHTRTETHPAHTETRPSGERESLFP